MPGPRMRMRRTAVNAIPFTPVKPMVAISKPMGKTSKKAARRGNMPTKSRQVHRIVNSEMMKEMAVGSGRCQLINNSIQFGGVKMLV